MIVAGGIGTRMKAEIPKQFMVIEKLPVLMHTVNVFYKFDSRIRIIVVLPVNQIEAWKLLCKGYNFGIEHEIRPGGETRFHSVKRNLDMVQENCLIAVHDGVRPLVSNETIIKCFREAEKYGNAVPCINIPETLRRVTRDGSEMVDRNYYKLIQTPQVFMSNILKEAYLQEYRKEFTDDASVVEYQNQTTIHLVEGNAENIKITYENDLLIAKSLLKMMHKNQGA